MALSTAWRLEQKEFYSRNDAYSKLTDNVRDVFKRYSMYIARYVYSLNGCGRITLKGVSDGTWGYAGCFSGINEKIRTNTGQLTTYVHVLESITGKQLMLGESELEGLAAESNEILPVLTKIHQMLKDEFADTYFIYATGKYKAYRGSTFPNIDNVIALMDKDILGGIADPELKVYFREFHALEMPLTVSMVAQYQVVNRLLANETVKLESDIDMEQYRDLSKSKCHIANYIYKVLLSKERNSKALDTKNKMSLIRLAYTTDAIYKEMKSREIKLADLANWSKVQIAKVKTENGLRMATLNELEGGAPGIKYVDSFIIEQKEHMMLCILAWALTGKRQYFGMAGYLYKESYDITDIDMVFKCKKLLMEAIEWYKTAEFTSAAELVQEFKQSGGVQYPDYSEDENVDFVSITDIVAYIAKTCKNNDDNYIYKTAYEITKSSYRKGKIMLSEKQIALLRRAYDMLTGKEPIKEKEDKKVEELRAMCETVVKAADKGIISKDEFALKIIGTLKSMRYERSTAKQVGFIEALYNKAVVGLASDLDDPTEHPDIMQHPVCKMEVDKGKLQEAARRAGEKTDDMMFPDLSEISNELGAGALWLGALEPKNTVSSEEGLPWG